MPRLMGSRDERTQPLLSFREQKAPLWKHTHTGVAETAPAVSCVPLGSWKSIRNIENRLRFWVKLPSHLSASDSLVKPSLYPP